VVGLTAPEEAVVGVLVPGGAVVVDVGVAAPAVNADTEGPPVLVTPSSVRHFSGTVLNTVTLLVYESPANSPSVTVPRYTTTTSPPTRDPITAVYESLLSCPLFQ
jgi:hypothetical protein